MTDSPSRRAQWFDGAYGGVLPWQTSVPSPRKAQGMIDQALRTLGVDPAKVTDANGWRVIGLGTAMGLINIVQLDFEEYGLVVWSPLLYLPADPRLQLQLFETLLRLNHHETGLARFALQDDLVVLSVQSNLALVGKTSGKTVAGLIGYVSAAGPLVVVSWDALEKQGLLAKDIQAFKRAVPRPAGFKVTASSAHLPVDESFTEVMVDRLVAALSALDKAFQRAVPPAEAPLPDFKAQWGLDLAVGKATIRNVDSVLTACPEPVRKSYSHLIQGWVAAGHQVYTNYSHLVYLRMTTEEHTYAVCVLKAPQKGQAALIDVFYSPSAEANGEPRRYEQDLTPIAGAVAPGTVTRIPMTDAFTVQEADKLLQVLLQLAADSPATPE